ncbi:putative homing endonuclease [Veterinaerplatzvirus Jeanpiccard]|uniref:Homing endonuclease n=1 Tax=Escherichia phage JeanPiccard TaxID=2851955 RepID=A0AAE7VTX0_9CAUD|nr:putative homing endonuclease [Escherichia phage JeanPiccard]
MNWNDIFDYRDGVLYWKISPRSRTPIGSVAGHLSKAGYITTSYMKRALLAHRVVWEMHNGPIPEGMQIDHINHNRSDNRICNLRLATVFDNNQNMSRGKGNRSGVVGVSWHKSAKKWCAEIHANGKKKYLGVFDSFDDAVLARKSAELHFGFHENHGA